MSVSAGGPLPYISASAGGSFNFGADRTEMFNSAKSITQGDNFQKSLQTIQDFAKSQNFNSLQDEGIRYAQNFSHAIDQVKSSQTAYQFAESHLDQTSQNATWMRQNAHSIRQSLNQDFVNWGQKRFLCEGGFSKVEEVLSTGTELDKQSPSQ